jgi:hypothetical protein
VEQQSEAHHPLLLPPSMKPFFIGFSTIKIATPRVALPSPDKRSVYKNRPLVSSDDLLFSRGCGLYLRAPAGFDKTYYIF